MWEAVINTKMAMGKSYKLWHKVTGQGPYSVLLEQRNREESLLFESLVIAALGTRPDIFVSYSTKQILF